MSPFDQFSKALADYYAALALTKELRQKFAPDAKRIWRNKHGIIGIEFNDGALFSVADSVLSRSELPWTPTSIGAALEKGI